MLASQYLTVLLIALAGGAATQDLPSPEPTVEPIDVAPSVTDEPVNGGTLGIWNDAEPGADTSGDDANANGAGSGQVPTTLQTITTRPSIPPSTESTLAPAPAVAGRESTVRDVNGFDGIGRVGRVLPTPTPAQHGVLPVPWPYGSSSSSSTVSP